MKKLPKKTDNLFTRLLFRYRQWRSDRNLKILNTMVAFNMDAAIRLANHKRDISNHKCWVVTGSGEHLVFLRYQKKGLVTQGLLKPVDFIELDRLASYVAMPVTEKDKRRGGLIRKYVGKPKK